jgi:hypothetical protein
MVLNEKSDPLTQSRIFLITFSFLKRFTWQLAGANRNIYAGTCATTLRTIVSVSLRVLRRMTYLDPLSQSRIFLITFSFLKRFTWQLAGANNNIYAGMAATTLRKIVSVSLRVLRRMTRQIIMVELQYCIL